MPRKPCTELPMNAALLASGTVQPKCVYCHQNHLSISCKTIVDATARKQILRKSGQCFNCLCKNHMNQGCHANAKCSSCRGKHHVSVFGESYTSKPRAPSTQDLPLGHRQGDLLDKNRVSNEVIPTTLVLNCGSVRTPMLLQTARAIVFKVSNPRKKIEA